MKTTTLCIIGAGILLSIQPLEATPNMPRPSEGGYGAFYSSLAPYGQWLEVDGVIVWRPLHIRPGWRPYVEGRWAWTDYGWYWISYEPFGWATFHYGRWYFDDYYGWIWIPDETWGPAWVEWRYNDDYVGWAPLPPYAVFTFSVGIRYTTHWLTPHHYWSFIPCHRFGTVIRYRDVVGEERARRLVGVTRSGATYEVDRDRMINRGVDRSFLERQGAGRLDPMEIRSTREPRQETIVRNPIDGRSRIEAFRPSREEFSRSDDPPRVTRGTRRISWETDKVPRSMENERQDSRFNQEEVKRRDGQDGRNANPREGNAGRPPSNDRNTMPRHEIPSPMPAPSTPDVRRGRNPNQFRQQPHEFRFDDRRNNQPLPQNIDKGRTTEGRPLLERQRPAPPVVRETPSNRTNSAPQPRRDEVQRKRD
ncbi:MAG: hypothetical protein HY966_05505 [Ignavibacteriales bacterium]|nr:hypothetical protein [Ignavibacteriales bacterium]